ncbi:MAG: hypothetical protein QXH91_05800, partial [Candidatus Bathyarchaeia archaeon]
MANQKKVTFVSGAMALWVWSMTVLYGQDAGDGTATRVVETVNTNPGFYDIVFGMGVVNFLIWLLIFCTSIAALAFIIDGYLQTRREKILPPNLIMGVRQA